jgi:pyridoxine 5-phosphate synthase
MALLSVNVNKIALLRNSRDAEAPSPVVFGRDALEAGAAGITVHPRPDQRHVRPDDVHQLVELLDEPAWLDREFNIEGNPLDAAGSWLELVEQARPDQATLVPDSTDQKTSDHGFTFDRPTLAALRPVVQRLRDAGCRVSVFVDPDPEQVARAADCGADRVELYTQPYAAAPPAERSDWLDRYAAAAESARRAGLGVNAGHDLTLANLPALIDRVRIDEVSIGHALTVDALHMGWTAAVQAYIRAAEGSG